MGFLSSIFKREPKPLHLNVQKKYNCPSATIVYGTKTGNAQTVAQQLQKTFHDYNIDSECFNISKYDINRILSENLLLIVMSTDGEGELPPNSRKFYGYLSNKDFPQIPQLKYSILALGDSSYEYFCGAGKMLDTKLNSLGAQSIIPRIDCDVDFKDDALNWIEKVFLFLSEGSKEKSQNPPLNIKLEVPDMEEATLTKREVLSKGESYSATYHIVLDNSMNNIQYESGDCIDVIPENPDKLVTEVLNVLKADAKQPINGGGKAFFDLLKYQYELTKLTRKVVRNYQATTSHAHLLELINNQDELNKYIADKDVLDLITDYPSNVDGESFVKILTPLHSRYYSIASGYKVFPDEIHLTIKTIRFAARERQYEGAASTYLNEYLKVGTNISFRLISSPTFHLPEIKDTPVILIGVGTGIAPYRGFLQDRKIHNIKDKTWLIWGDKKQSEDFLYEEELKSFKESGYLHHLDTCFSRDQEEKRYVQHIVMEKQAEIYTWIKNGAHVYLCGHSHMGHDVRDALSTIIMSQEGISKQESNQEIVRMQENGILHEDLY